MSVKDFHQLRTSCEGKLAKRTDGLSRIKEKPKYKSGAANKEDFSDPEDPYPSSSRISKAKATSPKKPAISFRASELPMRSMRTTATAKSKKPVSNIFAGRVFHVVGNVVWAEEMEALLRSHGAETVKNPTHDTFCVIADKLSRRLQNIIDNGSYDVVKKSWVDICTESKKFIPFQPEHMFFAKAETQEGFSAEFDEFGDSYTVQSSLAEFKELMESMMTPMKDEPMLSEDEMGSVLAEIDEELDERDREKLQKFSFLSDCKIAFLGEPDILLTSQVEFYGGEIAQDEFDDGVTHVITGDQESPSKKKHLSALLVKPKWLIDCLEKRELISEIPYTI